MTTEKEALARLLKDRGFRAQFAETLMRYALSVQIRLLREQRGWTHAELATRVSVPASAIAQWEQPDCRGITLAALKRLAHVFDVGLMVRFSEFSQFIEYALHDLEAAPASYTQEVKP